MSSGKTLGKYELRQQLGKGGMAEVWQAFQPGVDRLVAIKLMHKHLAADSDFVERFRREAKAVGQLQHNNIMRVIDFDVEDDEYYMVMDYIQGGTLGEYLKQHRALPSEEALPIVVQLADALAYAHQQGMIHRDIKPANVMFMDDSASSPILTDFGIARILSHQTMTMTGSMVGTPAYMSPEAISGEKVDERADIYSLGVMLYEMVVGRTPYMADTPYAMILKQMKDPIPPPRELNATIPAEVESLILKALEKDPNERYQSAADFRDAMLTTLEELTGKSTSSVSRSMSGIKRRASAAAAKAKPPSSASASAKQAPAESTSQLPLMAAVLGGVLAIALLMAGMVWALGNGGDEEAVNVVATATAEGEIAVVDATATEPPAPTETPAPTEPPAPTETPAPTEAPAPTQTPAPTETPLPTATSEPEPVLASLGSLRFTDQPLDEAILRAANCSLELDGVALPPPGTHYQLWLANEESGGLRNFGPLEVNNGRIAFSAQTDENLLATYDRLLISIEPNEDTDEAISEEIAFDAALSDDHQAIVQQFLAASDTTEGKGLLLGADEQARIAVDHGGFLQEALDAGDLELARRHAEHVVNILAGENNSAFGDLDGDDLAQNPGDGVGVMAYLNQALDLSEQALALSQLSDANLAHTQQVQTYSEKSAQKTEQVLEMALKVFAMDSVEETQSISQALNQALDQLLNGIDEDNNGIIDPTLAEGGVFAAYNSGLLMAQVPVFDENQQASDSSFNPTRLGGIHFVNNDVVTAGDYVMQVRLPIPPANNHYELWLVNEEGIVASLGFLEMQGEFISIAERTEQNLLTSVKQTLISLEPDNDTDPNPGLILFGGSHSEAMQTLIQQLMISDETTGKGFLLGAEEQAGIAREHTGFLRDALAADDFEGARRHAEHVVNILAGAEGERFNDWDGNGLAENPGDGVGLRAYLQQTSEQIEAAIESGTLSPKQAENGKRVITYSQNTQAALDDTIKKALQIFATDSMGEAKPMIEELSQLVDQLFSGSDQDGNGVIDPIRGEGGISTAIDFTILMAEMDIFALESEN